MTMLPFPRKGTEPDLGTRFPRNVLAVAGLSALFAVLLSGPTLQAQDDQLNTIHVPPSTTAAPNTAEPKGAEAPAATGPDALKIHPGSRIRMNVDMVLVPVTVTDP